VFMIAMDGQRQQVEALYRGTSSINPRLEFLNRLLRWWFSLAGLTDRFRSVHDA